MDIWFVMIDLLLEIHLLAKSLIWVVEMDGNVNSKHNKLSQI